MGLVGVNAPAALAAAPTFQHFQGSFTDVNSQTCGFPITISQNFASDVQFFYDQQGNLIRSLAHIQLRGTDSANGVSLPDTADFTHTFDFTTGINGDLGVTTHVIIPNRGTVLTDAGRVLSDEQREPAVRGRESPGDLRGRRRVLCRPCRVTAPGPGLPTS